MKIGLANRRTRGCTSVPRPDHEVFKGQQASRRSFATAELSDEKAAAISASRMDDRHKHPDSLLDE
jgi:hypothetical protein